MGPARPREPLEGKAAFLVSLAVHALGLILLGMTAFLAPKKPPVVPVFEIVNLEKPKLRPLTPKVKPPPEPPPPEPEPVKPPEAPKLTPKPSKAPAVKKPEPKVVREKEPEPDPAPVRDALPEQQQLQQIVSHVPADPRLSFWAGRVKKRAETLWNPPVGLETAGPVKTVIRFTVTRDGTVGDAAVATPSGNADLDELALRTIQRMEQVPPIPENYPEDLIQVSYEFIYSNVQ
jgi:TonB family protein